MAKHYRIAFISRPTLFKVRGGDTVQMESTAAALRKLGVEVDIYEGNKKLEYAQYDGLHFFNLIRPATILYHTRRSHLPYVVSPIYVDYSFYEKSNTSGLRKVLMNLLNKWAMEYVKSIARWIINGESVGPFFYISRGHKASMQKVLKNCTCLLPNSYSELNRLQNDFFIRSTSLVVPNAIDISLFQNTKQIKRDEKLVICVARIEGSKNQLNLIRAIQGLDAKLLIIGKVAPNHQNYYEACLNEADEQVTFLGELSHAELANYYFNAKVHAMPSWFETTGLSSLEAGYCGCQLVMGHNGDEKDYFDNEAYYCEPGSIKSIRDALKLALAADSVTSLPQKIQSNYTWQHAAERTLSAYHLFDT